MFNLILLLAFFSLSRVVLIGFALYEHQIDWHSLELLQTLSYGVLNDLVTSFYILTIISAIGLLIPRSAYQKILFYCTYFKGLLALLFLIVAEFTFWLEFSTRFNFIAVDYLVYTHEVIGNIRESYPVFIIFPAIILIAIITYRLLFKGIKNYIEQEKNIKLFFVYLSLAIISFYAYNPKITDIDEDNFLSELNKNGVYSLFSAFRHNSIDYPNFYLTRNEEEGIQDLASYIAPNSINSKILARQVDAKGAPKDYNIILITVESLSSEFLDDKNYGPLTPVLNDLIKKSAYFNNFYATGTRTVRGLEALTLSIPPLPGQSIVRRKNNSNLYSIGSLLKAQDYDLKFIYGGYGYFDNMNSFFSKNHFNIYDRGKMPQNEIKFTNIWGISDEDLYMQTIKQADLSYASQKKFFSLVMTTSNHRPYTYPKDESEFPHNRLGGVMYSDYAIGEFFKVARTKAWFDNTIFIITADHCAGSAGKVALPPEKYHIPLLIYAPQIIAPQVINKMTSQIDVAPTIMGLLNISYTSRFFGNDAFTKTYQNAFISTFQKLGYIQDDKLIVLSPGKTVQTYKILKDDQLEETSPDQTLIDRAIDYYQSAYYLFQQGALKNEAK